MLSLEEIIYPVEQPVELPALAWLDDGTPWNPNTGEVYTQADLDALGVQAPKLALPCVDDRDSLNWALDRRQAIEASRDAIKRRKLIVIQNMDKQIRDKDSHLSWWSRNFSAQVYAFARTLLTGKKKSVTVDFGTVAFRETKGTNKIKDMDAAVAWMRVHRPDLIKVTESVTVTDVLAVKTKLLDGMSNATASEVRRRRIARFMESTGPGENKSIDTGFGPNE